MCLTPVTIINPSKYVSTHFKDQFLLQVPCGRCAECESRNSQSWMYRSIFEFQDCLRAGGFVYFDTLTYSEQNVPRIRDIISCGTADYCFNHKHITDFMKRLRIELDRHYQGVSCRFFISSEYGTKSSGTHRPHYHILFFVYGKISVADFSRLVSKHWTFGRTDGLPYRPYLYIESHNYIHTSTPSNILHTCNYVTKYVQKSCAFQSVLDKRLESVMIEASKRCMPDSPDEWLNSLHAKRVRIKLRRSINQFHRQSLHYGESALADLDINSIFDNGTLYMPHFKGILQPIGVPTYYKRKLFYDLVEIDKTKSWQLNSLGIQYKKLRLPHLIDDLTNRYEAVRLQHHLDYDSNLLADYVLNHRGRFRAHEPSYTLENRLPYLTHHTYSTLSDKEHLDALGVSTKFIGNNSIGYRFSKIPQRIRFSNFISKFVYLNPDYENQLKLIEKYTSCLAEGKQRAFESKQRLADLYSSFKP